MIGSIMPISKLAKNINWGNEIEVREFLQFTFAASDFPPDVNLRIYTELMMFLSSLGLVFVTKTKADRKKFLDGLCSEIIQEFFLPKMDYKSAGTGSY